MSRSWQRMVERNTKQVNKRRKKEGKESISGVGRSREKADRYRGRSYIVPILLLFLLASYVLLSRPWDEATFENINPTMYYVTLACYALLALFYFLRRPYLAVTKSALETRRFTGYKTLRPSEIRKIVLQPGYVVIETVKGANWVFSRFLNLYPIAEMSERLRAFAADNEIVLEVQQPKSPSSGEVKE